MEESGKHWEILLISVCGFLSPPSCLTIASGSDSFWSGTRTAPYCADERGALLSLLGWHIPMEEAMKQSSFLFRLLPLVVLLSRPASADTPTKPPALDGTTKTSVYTQSTWLDGNRVKLRLTNHGGLDFHRKADAGEKGAAGCARGMKEPSSFPSD